MKQNKNESYTIELFVSNIYSFIWVGIIISRQKLGYIIFDIILQNLIVILS